MTNPFFKMTSNVTYSGELPAPRTPSLDVQSYPPPHESALVSTLDNTEQATCQPLRLVGSSHCSLLEDNPAVCSCSWKAEKNTCPLFDIQLLVNKRIKSLLPYKAVCISITYQCRYLYPLFVKFDFGCLFASVLALS